MLHLYFTPFPLLTTERLVLRELKLADAAQVFALRSNAQVNQFLNRAVPQALSDVDALIQKLNGGVAKNEWIIWVMSLKNETKLIGTICLWNISQENCSAEIGCELHPDFQRRGIMREAMAKVIAFGFQVMNLKSIDGWTKAGNRPSINLLEKLHFEKNQTLEKQHAGEKELAGMVAYSLKSSDFDKL